ncbi:RagB/SusD family nutrient uptake outer membrane protein [Pedobacter sp. HMWF019]|uniref:RagB/SusD family nutrient uptake outer membrane protein n=1 Tax=Pedobacter sp. HMWF019 TaxID=2056856 RepID=UPI001304BD7E|nr:RagB/SusD family nutrient uptake outer membrane protein [Pedobacter sp. HMWF019]
MKVNNLNKHLTIKILFIFCLFTIDCKKQNDWLDIKNDKRAVVPTTLSDFQAMLDNTGIFNEKYSTAGLVGADNYYLTDNSYKTYDETTRNLYIWNNTIWEGGISTEWNNYFTVIQLANVILDGLKKNNTLSADYNNIKGQALFHRAISYYNLSQLFCKPYSKTAETDLGLPIRLNSDVNETFKRASLDATYQQIINDALEASKLLPTSQSYLQRPINAAAFALLAKTYLNMSNYNLAKNFADKTLNIRPDLLDYNTIVSTSLTYRFSEFGKANSEILFYAQALIYPVVSPLTSAQGLVSNDLYQSYEDADLRKQLFYFGNDLNIKFRGAYSGNRRNFAGLATNEIYLIRAECNAREGNIANALSDLNMLLINRYKTNNFTKVNSDNQEEVLKFILKERRKELPFVSNIRWEDLRRLNQETRFQKVLSRTINGITYSLSPNDKRYTLPIPLQEIQLSGIQQNDR